MKVIKIARLLVIAITVILIAIGCEGATIVEDLILDGIDEDSVIITTCLKSKSVMSAPSVVAGPINREEILAFPGENATDEERQKHGDLVVAAAVNVNILDISGCTPNPLVIEVGLGESIEIKNDDPIAHTLYHGGISITIPARGTRGIVLSDFFGKKGDGIAGYGCDDRSAGIFYTNSRLVVKPSEKQKYTTFRVVEDFPSPHGTSVGVEGVRVATFECDGGVKETAADGSVTFRSDLPLTILLEKPGYIITGAIVEREWEEVVLPSAEKDITFRVVEPLLRDKNGPGIEGVRVTCLEGSDEGMKETAADGSVTFFGTPPLTIRIEKPGYITTEAVVVGESEVVFPNEWPEEAEEAIRQLGFTELIASGEVILRWGDDEYLEALGKVWGDGLGGWFDCPVLLVRDWQDRRKMLWTLVHELTHGWIALKSDNVPCYPATTSPDYIEAVWVGTEEGKAWIAALEKDLQEIGPIPDFDDRIYNRVAFGEKSLSELPRHSLAEFYGYWYIGFEETKEELKRLYRLAPNRCQYLEDQFGPPPPR